jgi:hypothetical protein
MKTNKPIKKGDNKWTGPYAVTAVYSKACAVKLSDSMRIFPVFYNFVAGAVALKGFASSPEHIATHAPL